MAKRKIQRPAMLNGLIAFQEEPRPIPLRNSERWVPWLWIGKSGRSWVVEFDPFEGSSCSKKLTPLGAAAACCIAKLGDGVFNSAFRNEHPHGVAFETTNDWQATPKSYMSFKTDCLQVACTVATRLLFLPDECYTELYNHDYLPDDPIQRIISIAQKDSETDIKPFMCGLSSTRLLP
jgi:hypothetical protein